MKRITLATSAAAIAIGLGLVVALPEISDAQGRSLQNPAVDLTISDNITVPAADEQTNAIVAAANAYLETLSDEQVAASIYAFDDNLQRANWSNFPDGAVKRGGVMIGDLNDEQRDALWALLNTVLSEEGVRNVDLQLAAEETLNEGGNGGVRFGHDYYYTSFLGTPSADAPWMFQFGGHHLAINATVVGPDISFGPLLSGGEPLNITFEGEEVYITETETRAAQTFMDALDDAQQDVAIVSSRYINLVAGPGEDGAVIAPEGIKGSDLSIEQKALLLDVISARLMMLNADDYAAKFETVSAEIDDTYFGWWGPTGTLGGAYFRIVGPSIAIEYSPQGGDGTPTDHAHNIMRETGNDYGAAWIAAN